ncbi:hypothetical protein GCHA_0562 [Paraglaciecola chathamensis S18K6]|uniref:Uncharacterized protein n=1 Tax=Paraglaciecola chathamensis S18K6 TaxID=1127672 RepID=A0AAV3UTU3_9ALTE|nr:hypothetical protein GCHA_0562 [Paraglaciecola chathamensis S18K6]
MGDFHDACSSDNTHRGSSTNKQYHQSQNDLAKRHTANISEFARIA